MPESMSSKPRVALIGLGSMGFGMATSLKRAGFEVTGCDVSADAVARFVAEGGAGARTPAEAAKGADIVVSVVVNATQTEIILFGKDGVAETLAKGAVFVSSATMDPDVARRLAKQLEATGRHYLDAPISGGAQRAAQGELTILASGSPAAFALPPFHHSSNPSRSSTPAIWLACARNADFLRSNTAEMSTYLFVRSIPITHVSGTVHASRSARSGKANGLRASG